MQCGFTALPPSPQNVHIVKYHIIFLVYINPHFGVHVYYFL